MINTPVVQCSSAKELLPKHELIGVSSPLDFLKRCCYHLQKRRMRFILGSEIPPPRVLNQDTRASVQAGAGSFRDFFYSTWFHFSHREVVRVLLLSPTSVDLFAQSE